LLCSVRLVSDALALGRLVLGLVLRLLLGGVPLGAVLREEGHELRIVRDVERPVAVPEPRRADALPERRIDGREDVLHGLHVPDAHGVDEARG